jgi:predicted Zn-dependent peptidase
LHVAREHLKGSLMLSLESTTSRMSNLARQEIYFGKQHSLGDTLRNVGSVTLEQVHDLARDLIGKRKLSLAAVGRVGRLRLDASALQP